MKYGWLCEFPHEHIFFSNFFFNLTLPRTQIMIGTKGLRIVYGRNT